MLSPIRHRQHLPTPRLIYRLVKQSLHTRGKATSIYCLTAMAPANGTREAPATESAAPRKLKILMLHGYTQSGPLFHSKTRSLEKLLKKSFPATRHSPLYPTYPGGITLSYPTAPLRLLPADIPGFEPRGEEQPEAYGWWKRETGSGAYLGLGEGLDTIAAAIRELGGVDGVIGFSQGAAAAAMVASLLQPGRQAAFAAHYSQSQATAFPWPKSWDGLQDLHPEGLKFAVCYSGFYAANELYRGFYEPKIDTRVLHFIGSLDSVVEEGRSLALVEVTERGTTVYHPGGHFVPAGKEMAGVLVGFIRDCCEVKKIEESVKDMDVPF